MFLILLRFSLDWRDAWYDCTYAMLVGSALYQSIMPKLFPRGSREAQELTLLLKGLRDLNGVWKQLREVIARRKRAYEGRADRISAEVQRKEIVAVLGALGGVLDIA